MALAEAKFDYEAEADTELSLYPGQMLEVLEETDGGWWFVKAIESGASGWVPSNFVELIGGDEIPADENVEAPSENDVPEEDEPLYRQEEQEEEEQEQEEEEQEEYDEELEPEPAPLPPKFVAQTQPQPVPVSVFQVSAASPAPVMVQAAAPLPLPVRVQAVQAAQPQAVQAAPRPQPAPAPLPAAVPKPVYAAPIDPYAKICWGCKGVVTDSYVSVKDKHFHPDHFTCIVCNGTLSGRPFIQKDENFYCEEDYHNTFSPHCGECNLPVKGKYMSALGKAWHPGCFVCTVCKQPFVNDRFRKNDNKPYCEAHFLELFAIQCLGCKQNIDGPIFEALGRKFHLECFVCAEDEVPIGETASFHFQEDKFWCDVHFQKRFIHNCARCELAVDSKYIKVMQSYFHEDCFLCANCDVPLQGLPFEPLEDQFICPSCGTQLRTAKATAAAEAKVAAAHKAAEARAAQAAEARAAQAVAESAKLDHVQNEKARAQAEAARQAQALAESKARAEARARAEAQAQAEARARAQAEAAEQAAAEQAAAEQAAAEQAAAEQAEAQAQMEAISRAQAEAAKSASAASAVSVPVRASGAPLLGKAALEAHRTAQAAAAAAALNQGPQLDSFPVYTFDDLTGPDSASLPDLNLKNRESHLSREEFQIVFGMSKLQFAEKKGWQQAQLKKAAGIW